VGLFFGAAGAELPALPRIVRAQAYHGAHDSQISSWSRDRHCWASGRAIAVRATWSAVRHRDRHGAAGNIATKAVVNAAKVRGRAGGPEASER